MATRKRALCPSPSPVKQPHLPLAPVHFPILHLLYLHQHIPLYHSLCLNVIRSIHHYLLPHYLLPAVYTDLLVLYNLKEMRAQLVSKPPKIPPFAALCLIGDCKALAFERFFASSEVFELNYANYTVETLPNMIETRSFPGLMHTKASIYVFGGYIDCKYLEKCEKFSQKTGKWSLLPNLLTARRIFTLSLYKHCIYLPPIGPPEVLEVFSTLTDSYSPLPYAENRDIMRRYCVMCVGCEEGLVLIGRTGRVWSWEPGREARERRQGVYLRANATDLSVVVGRCVYWINETVGKLNRFSLNTGDFTTIKVSKSDVSYN